MGNGTGQSLSGSTGFARGDQGIAGVAKAFALAIALSVPIAAPGVWMIAQERASRAAVAGAEEARLASLQALLAAPAGPVLDVDSMVHARDLFVATCAACHGVEARGVTGLGKDLTQSWFVASLDDSALVKFLEEGRPADSPLNTTRIPMPPKGGRADLTGDDLAQLAGYLRGLQDPRRMPQLPEMVAKPAVVSDDEKAAALAAAGGDAELAEYIASGTKLYARTCAACHGPDVRGVKGNGKDLIASELVKTLNDDDLLAFIQRGRDPGDPANTTGIAMPPKGGNPALSEDDILDIIAYLRSLQGAANAG